MSTWTRRTETKRLIEFRGVWVDPAAVDAVRLADSFVNWKIEVHLSGTIVLIDTGESLRENAKPVLRDFIDRLAASDDPGEPHRGG